ncbi:hypothetical protein QCE69_11720 [Caballeronia sp. LZ032]|nr:hypothetical protein [Caballeronia sp. LZ032]MDR5878937.1 hypothetical protein [Caballeronia sp. LZ032]
MTSGRIRTRPWESAGHLRTEEDIAGYSEACLRDSGDDPAFIAHALGVVACARDRNRPGGPCRNTVIPASESGLQPLADRRSRQAVAGPPTPRPVRTYSATESATAAAAASAANRNTEP